MSRRHATAAALAAFAAVWASSGALADSPPPVTPIDGVWQNPKRSVQVEISACGAGACGEVVWASAKAQADARKGGTENLIGLRLFRNFVQDGRGTWRGKVFVPDLNATFTGTAVLVDANTIKAKGCLVAHILCKSQTWTRVDAARG